MNDDGIDKNFYSRQIGTYGLDTIKNIMKMKVLIYGLRGLGTEVAKNIILIGPKSVSLYDKNLITYYDLGSGYYFNENQTDKFKRDEGCLSKLIKLNPYVDVNILEEDLILSIKKFNIIVITELINIDLLNKINEICRINKIGLIYGAVLGLITFCFVDFGQKFIIQDENGRPPKKNFIKDISNSKNCKITFELPDSNKSNTFNDGDTIIIKEIEGMIELNDKIKKIKIKQDLRDNEFFIDEDSTKYKKYIKGGIIEEIKIPKEKNYLKFADCLIQPRHQEKLIDDEKDQLRHSIIYGIMKFYNENNYLPELNDEEKSKKIMGYSKQFFEERKQCDDWFIDSSEDFDEIMAIDLAKWSRAELISICSFMGGILAQEIVKFTGKFIPIDQWLWFDFYDSVKELKVSDRKLKKSRYDEQIAIFGNVIQNKIENSNIFMIGAGAIGCEYLKIFSMMGFSTSKNSKVTVTDNDNIEISNLNRQFLFKKCHTGLNKAICACKEVKLMNKDFNCEAQTNLVYEGTEYIYTEEFYNKQDFIINAVDNNTARKYIDSQCILFNKKLIDSGTEGLKAYSQLIIPNVTDHGKFGYANNTIPMCTLRQFPSLIEHCIEWGKDKFDEYFFEDINFINKFISEPKKNLEDILKEESKIKTEKLYKLKYLLSLINNGTTDEIINNSIEIIKQIFIKNIQNIIDLYPENYKNDKGDLFWSGSKKFPSTIKVSENNPLIIEFISSYTNIISRIFNITYNEEKINNRIINLIKIQNKKHKNNINSVELESEINNLLQKLENIKINIYPEKFEKDNDKNNHINFIYSCSNLRAENYKITKCDKLKVKFISGKIIPAVATTTACIAGFSSMQIFTLLHNSQRSFLNELTLNLGLNLFKISKPYPVDTNLIKNNGKIVLFQKNLSIWDNIEINGPLLIKDFISDIKKKYDITIMGIYPFNKNIPLITNKESLEKSLEAAYCQILNIQNKFLRKTFGLKVEGKDSSKKNVIMPTFIYRIKDK